MHRFILALAVLALPLLAAACGSDSDNGTSPTASSGGDKAGHITLKMFDNSFKPKEVTVKAGTKVTFDLPNVGILPHNMHIASERGVYRESPWMTETIGGGKTTSLEWDVPATAGKYLFRCDVHEVEMTGTITVE